MNRLERWEKRTEWPLGFAALAFLVAYAWPILQPDLAPGLKAACRVVNLGTWAVFIADYATRVGLAPNRGRFFARHIIDLLAVALPLLRPLRLLRIVTMLRLLNRSATASLQGKVAVYVGSASALVVFCASLAVLDAERGHAGANIETFGDAAWWSFVTISTVGYGDRFPVTGQGRFVAVGLMLAGVALLGIVTASFAAWLVNRVRQVEESGQTVTRQDIAEVLDELRLLQAQLGIPDTQVVSRPPDDPLF